MQIDQGRLIQYIQKEPGLTPEERHELITHLSNKDNYEDLVHGAVGAGITYVITKYFNMSKSAQIILSLAGFGVGKYLLDRTRKHDTFLRYNKEKKVYVAD